MRWKPAWLEKFKPESFSAHMGWGCAIGMVQAMRCFDSGWPAWAAVTMGTVSGAFIGYIWEWAYWQVSRLLRKRRGIVYKATGWPDVPPDALVQVKCGSSQVMSARRSDEDMSCQAWRCINKWCEETGRGFEFAKMTMQTMSVRLYIHPAFDRRRASWADIPPWIIGGAIGSVVAWLILSGRV